MKHHFTRFILKFSVITVFLLGSSIGSLPSYANKVIVVPLVDSQLPGIPASRIVELDTAVSQTITPVELQEVDFNGVTLGAYVVPNNRVLVITSITFLPSITPGINQISLIQGQQFRRAWRIPNSEITQLHFSPGMLINSGQNLRARGSNQNESIVETVVRGYEVPK